ncbi:STAS domain-containing protein [Leptospira sp. 96542]|nr:STAS domain-containing protein [Leptospira sp. 96542]
METTKRVFSIQLKGGLDGTSADDLFRYFENQLEKGYQKYLFNFFSVNFITSNGISTLVKIHKRMNSLGLVYAMYGLGTEVEDVLRLVGLYSKLPVFRSHLEAETFINKEIPKEKIESHTTKQSPFEPKEKIRFYFSGKPEGSVVSSKVPVSKLDVLPEETKSDEKKEPLMNPMESVLEETLNRLRLEIKDTLNNELEKRLSIYKQTPAPPDEFRSPNFPTYIQSKSKKSEMSERIVQCEVCGTRLRLQKYGKHKCPNCMTEFQLGHSGNIRFLEKLN